MVFEYYGERKRLQRVYTIRGTVIGLLVGLAMLTLGIIEEPLLGWLASFEGSPWAPPPHYLHGSGGSEAWLDYCLRFPSTWALIGNVLLMGAVGAWAGGRYANDPSPGEYKVTAYAWLFLLPVLPLMVVGPPSWFGSLIFLAWVVYIPLEFAVRRGKLAWLRAPVLRDKFPEDFPVTEDA